MTFGIIGNLQKEGLREEVLTLAELLRKRGMEFCLEEELAPLLGRGERLVYATKEECVAHADMIVALGGDGTILAAARLVGTRQIPILGVNLGKLGFLAEVSPDEMEKAIGEILEGHYVIEDRLVLQASHPSTRDGATFAVNDFVVARSRSMRTGSTAYALSNGGPIVSPTTNVIGITPISPHTLSGRPLIISDNAIIRLKVDAHQKEVLFSADGQTEEYLTTPTEIEIRKASHSLRLVRRMGRSYFDVLRAKLFWGQDPRA
jgi:NAD+ kinase